MNLKTLKCDGRMTSRGPQGCGRGGTPHKCFTGLTFALSSIFHAVFDSITDAKKVEIFNPNGIIATCMRTD